MNEYKIQDLKVGLKESFTAEITEDMMSKFLSITGDENPMHLDRSFAESKGFKDRVVYGMLTASLISTLGGMYLPGKYCLIRGVEIKFANPVFVGDVLTITGKVKNVEEALKYLEIGVTIKNQDGKKVLRGTLKAGVLNEQQ